MEEELRKLDSKRRCRGGNRPESKPLAVKQENIRRFLEAMLLKRGTGN